MGNYSVNEDWHRVGISHIESLRDAVFGANLEATQMTTGPLSGSLVFAEHDGATYGSGFIGGSVSLVGPLSLDKVTIGVGLHVAPGTWHWMRERRTGDIGVFLPGDEHDSRYTPGTLYATVTISTERLEREAAEAGLVLDRRTLGGTGFHSRQLDPGVVHGIERDFRRLHAGHASKRAAGRALLDAVIGHLGRLPWRSCPPVAHGGHARIARMARAYILEHLSEPIALDDIASAAMSSRRTLHRAFAEIFDDTPQGFVRRLRLHRIRHDLAGPAERACTITLVANHWGLTELGRMSGWYRELFGERPRDTMRRARLPPDSLSRTLQP